MMAPPQLPLALALLVLAGSAGAASPNQAGQDTTDQGQAPAQQVRLSTGEVLSVEVISLTPETATVRHPLLGVISLPRASVELLPAAAATPAATVEAPAAAASETPAPAPDTASGAAAAEAGGTAAGAAPPADAPAEPDRKWRFKFTFGGAGTSGNSENLNLTTQFTAVREVETMKTSFDAGYFFGASNGDKSENRFTAGGNNEWLFPEKPYFFFADARYDYDEFNSWLHRLTGHVGAGWHLIDPPPLKLDGLLGIGFIKEWKSDNEDLRPEGLAGFRGEWAIAENHSIVFESIYYPDLSDLEVFRWVNSAAWSWKIDRDRGLGLTAGVQHEYQSQVSPDRDKNDVRAYAGVDWEF